MASARNVAALRYAEKGMSGPGKNQLSQGGSVGDGLSLPDDVEELVCCLPFDWSDMTPFCFPFCVHSVKRLGLRAPK